MNLEKHYSILWEASLSKFRQGGFEYDRMIDDPSDNRMGLTLLLRPDSDTIDKIRKILDSLKVLEPAQYYYPDTDIHITVLSIISCYAGFQLHQISVEDYVTLIQEALHGMSSFEIMLKGITASSACILVQGFPVNDALNELRNILRKRMSQSDLQQSLDERYLLKTAHSTVVRFKRPLKNELLFISELLKYRDYPFGNFEVKELELVYGDWYQRKYRVKHLHTFRLRDQ
jgi:2'-5' RNA ligase